MEGVLLEEELLNLDYWKTLKTSLFMYIQFAPKQQNNEQQNQSRIRKEYIYPLVN